MELNEYLATMRRRWQLLLATVAVCVGVASLLTWQTTPMYASTAKLFISTQAADDVSNAYQGSLLAKQRIASYADMVTDQELAERVGRSLEGSDPEQLSEQVQARVVPETLNLEITALSADPLTARDIAQTYAEQLSQLIGELESPSGQTQSTIRASIIDDAQIADAPATPHPPRNLLLGLGAGLLLGTGLAVARELSDSSVVSADDIGAITAAPVLATIDFDAGAARLSPRDMVSKTTPWGEAFRVLRTNMQYVEVDHHRQTFVVTSPSAGDGKSTVATSLAVTLSLAGRNVVLVETDLRRPEMAARLGLDADIGTTSVLIGRLTLDEAMQSYGETGLRVLPCGPRPPNPSEMLQSTAMTKMLSELRDIFDIIILDAPPLLPVTDAALLTAQADGALVVVRHGKTSRADLADALERIHAVEGNAAGVVVNMAPVSRSAHKYAYEPDPVPRESARRRRRLRHSPGGSNSA